MKFPPLPVHTDSFSFVSRTHTNPKDSSFLRQGYCRLRPHQTEFVTGFYSAPDVLKENSLDGFLINKYFGTFHVQENYFVVAAWAGVYPQVCKEALFYAGLDIVRRMPVIEINKEFPFEDSESLLQAFRGNAVNRAKFFMKRHAPGLEEHIKPYLELNPS